MSGRYVADPGLRCSNSSGDSGSFLFLFERAFTDRSRRYKFKCGDREFVIDPKWRTVPRSKLRREYNVYIPSIGEYGYGVGGTDYCSILKRLMPDTVCTPIVSENRVRRIGRFIHLLDRVTPSTLLYMDMVRTGLYDPSYARLFIEDSIEHPIEWGGFASTLKPVLHTLNRTVLSRDVSLYEATRIIDRFIGEWSISLVIASMMVYEPVLRFLDLEMIHPPRWIGAYGMVCSLHSTGRLDYYSVTGLREIYNRVHSIGIVWCDKRWVSGQGK